MSLKDRNCATIAEGTPPLDEARISSLLPELRGWTAKQPAPGQPRQLHKTLEFEDFVGAMAFLNRLAATAEAEQHHPDFCVHCNRVDVTLWTHTVKGLSENDFILAAKLDAVFT